MNMLIHRYHILQKQVSQHARDIILGAAAHRVSSIFSHNVPSAICIFHVLVSVAPTSVSDHSPIASFIYSLSLTPCCVVQDDRHHMASQGKTRASNMWRCTIKISLHAATLVLKVIYCRDPTWQKLQLVVVLTDWQVLWYSCTKLDSGMLAHHTHPASWH